MSNSDSNPKILKEVVRVYRKIPQGVTEKPTIDADDIVPEPIDVCVERASQSFAPVLYADFDQETQSLSYQPAETFLPAVKKLPAQDDGFTGHYFVEHNCAVFHQLKDDTAVKVIDAILRVVFVKEVFAPDGSSDRSIACRVQSVCFDDDEPHIIEVPEKKFKNICMKMHQLYPEITVLMQYAKVIEEYLSCVFQNRPKAEVRREARCIGWTSFSPTASYVIGCDPIYHRYRIPTEPLTVAPAYIGQRFLEIGNRGFQISTLWIASHLPFMIFWFEKVGIHFQSVFYLQGETNSFKTTVCSLVSNVFNTDRDRAVVRLNSTKAGIQKILSFLPDTLVCLDDFSNSEVSSRTHSKDVAETILRAVGDGQFSAKMDMASSSIVQATVRTVIIMTGEDTLGLSQSSEFRTITIPVQRGVFDADKIRYFEDRPSEIPRYFTAFIHYLEQTMPSNIERIKDLFHALRDQYRKTMEIPRLAEAKAILMLSVQIVGNFYHWSPADAEFRSLSERIDEVFEINTKHSQRKAPEILFLEALCAIASTKALPIAENEDWYIKNSTSFAGFKDVDGNLWLLPDKAYDAVVKFFRKRNIDFLTDIGNLKKRLYAAGISIGKFDKKNNKYQYVCRGHRPDASGSRKRFLVIKHQKIENFLDTEEDD